MSYEVSIRPEAEAEIGEAYRWYEQQQDGLGSDFIVSLEEGMAKIIEGPEKVSCCTQECAEAVNPSFPLWNLLYDRSESGCDIGSFSWSP